MLETEKEVFMKINKSGRGDSSQSSIDGEMCNILIAETNKLKGDVENLKQSLGWKENEVKQLKHKIRDAEMEYRNAQNELRQYRSDEMRLNKEIKSEELADYQTTEFTSKTTLRRYVEELVKECGESKSHYNSSTLAYSKIT